ncbi:hypothetical protein ACFQU5_17090 [Ureibacillus sp. GCM10028918]
MLLKAEEMISNWALNDHTVADMETTTTLAVARRYLKKSNWIVKTFGPPNHRRYALLLYKRKRIN